MTYQSGREKYCVEMKAILYAFLAAVFYAINIPASKVLLWDVGPTTGGDCLGRVVVAHEAAETFSPPHDAMGRDDDGEVIYLV